MNASGVTLILLLSIVFSSASIMISQYSYAQGLDNSYVNAKCGLSIQYPSNWKFEEKTWDDPAKVINYIVEFEPDTLDGFNSVIGVEINEISWPTEKSIEGIKDFEEDYIRTGGIIESSETTTVAGFPAQKIVYIEHGDDITFKKMEVDILAFDREYKVTYDTSGEEFFDKNLSTIEKMINTLKISDPTFEGIIC